VQIGPQVIRGTGDVPDDMKAWVRVKASLASGNFLCFVSAIRSSAPIMIELVASHRGGLTMQKRPPTLQMSEPSNCAYAPAPVLNSSDLKERGIKEEFIERLRDLKYTHRPDITDRATLERNFREKFESLNRVRLTDTEFARLLDEIVTADVFAAAKTLRSINSFTRDDGTPLNYSLVNLKDWCKNDFEVVNQLRINTDYSHHRYDVINLINGVPLVQVELKTLGVNPRRSMEQIVEYKNDPGNGYTRTLLCFLQLFVEQSRPHLQLREQQRPPLRLHRDYRAEGARRRLHPQLNLALAA
jgi:hypothetical protein